jgi:hypothetical protein
VGPHQIRIAADKGRLDASRLMAALGFDVNAADRHPRQETALRGAAFNGSWKWRVFSSGRAPTDHRGLLLPFHPRSAGPSTTTNITPRLTPRYFQNSANVDTKGISRPHEHLAPLTGSTIMAPPNYRGVATERGPV